MKLLVPNERLKILTGDDSEKIYKDIALDTLVSQLTPSFETLELIKHFITGLVLHKNSDMIRTMIVKHVEIYECVIEGIHVKTQLAVLQVEDGSYPDYYHYIGKILSNHSQEQLETLYKYFNAVEDAPLLPREVADNFVRFSPAFELNAVTLFMFYFPEVEKFNCKTKALDFFNIIENPDEYENVFHIVSSDIDFILSDLIHYKSNHAYYKNLVDLYHQYLELA